MTVSHHSKLITNFLFCFKSSFISKKLMICKYCEREMKLNPYKFKIKVSWCCRFSVLDSDSVRNISPVCPLETINFYKIVFVCLSKLVLYFYQT